MFLGGTNLVGPPTVGRLFEQDHEVAVAHTGAHEHPLTSAAVHLHGSREEILEPGGLIERFGPEVVIDTFAGGATAAKAVQLAEAASRLSIGHLIVTSSIDTYQHCVDAGIGDGTGATALPNEAIPLTEESPLRSAPYPGGSDAHDNVAMEAALWDARRVTALRPGAIYGPHPETRKRALVERIARGERSLKLPDGGTQLFHRVAVERVARAIVAAIERAPEGFWACNVVDPTDLTYARLAAEIARQLDWTWEPERVPFSDTEHPWQTTHPVICSDRRLREVLGVEEPDPKKALAETVAWLWERRDRAPGT